jgi:hypothetical protein
VDGYGITGLVLLFTALAWVGRDLLKARRPKRGLHDREVKHVTLLMRLRNASAISMICTISVFFLAYSGMTKVAPESAEYVARNNLGDFTAGMAAALLVVTVVLYVLSKRANHHLVRSVRRDTIRARLRGFKAKRSQRVTRS